MTLEQQAQKVITHDQVIEFSVSELESLTDAQLNVIYAQALNVTRPEYAGRVIDSKDKVAVYIPPAKKRALEMLKDSGVDLSFMNKRRKR